VAEIRGQFDVSLPIPIGVGADFPGPGVAPCLFQIDGDRVTILPLSVAQVNACPDGDYEPPKLTEIRVWITREIDLGQEQEEGLVLSPGEERAFEKVLVEATRLLVTTIKHKTNQWDLDTKHPVYAYSSTYSRGDMQLGTAWPMEQGAKRIPEYALGIIITSGFQEELSRDVWKEVIAEVPRPAPVSLHDELLSDAKTFRSYMRYDASALYAAIASELMLEKACWNFLRTKSGLSGKQCEAIVNVLKVGQLAKLIEELDPSLSVKREGVRKLFHLRNKIAHGKAQSVTWEEAHKALSTAEQLKQDLAHIL
jgi:hypothetical protein